MYQVAANNATIIVIGVKVRALVCIPCLLSAEYRCGNLSPKINYNIFASPYCFCNPRPSINCCCRPRECYPCSMSGFLLYKACALGLCNGTPTFLKVHVNLLEPHTMLCTTPTDPSLYLLVIVDICVATYPQYANSTNSNACLGFGYPGQIQPDCYLGHQVSSCDPVSKLSQNIPEPVQYVIYVAVPFDLRCESGTCIPISQMYRYTISIHVLTSHVLLYTDASIYHPISN